MIETLRSIELWQNLKRNGILGRKSLGFVPTMGALHEGHLSLVRKSKAENELTLVSIFVNPTQFDQVQDLDKYPRTIEQDQVLLEKAGVDYLLLPDYKSMYPDEYLFKVEEKNLSRDLCGEFRPGHFQGMLTVVLKLLQIADADNAYFGEKDYQQYLLVKKMAQAFFFKTQIVPCPTIRDHDGLALSSRNTLLDKAQRKLATQFPLHLQSKSTPAEITSALVRLGFVVDYITDKETDSGVRRFGAVRLGVVRLIDNVKI